MEKYIFDESNGLWYELQGDYYIPCLTVPDDENYSIDIWGQRHERWLKENCKVDISILSQVANSTLIFTILIYLLVKQKAGLSMNLRTNKA